MSTVTLEQLRNIAKALNLDPHANETALSLKTRIEAATKATPLPPTGTTPAHPSVIEPSALLRNFEEGRFTDCSILVKIAEDSAEPMERGPKRLKTRDSESPDERTGGGEQPEVRVIKAHLVILTSRSAYFERAVLGKWSESKDKAFEVLLADEEEYLTFHRLIKLCYGTTFVKDGDRDLDFGELVRLTRMANAFECLDAVKGCAAALQKLPLDWEGAVDCIMLTDLLKGVEGMASLALRAKDALADALGFVHDFYKPIRKTGLEQLGQDSAETDTGFGGLLLDRRVKDLSPIVFETLLSSERLKLKSENEACWLLLSWIEAQGELSEEERQALFERMAKHVRFHAMDPGYVLHVSESPRIKKAGLEAKVLRESLAYAPLARRSKEQRDACTACTPLQLLPSRAPAGEVSWEIDRTFSPVEIASITIHKPLTVVVGLVGGMPWVFKLCRIQKDGVPDRLGVFSRCHKRFRTTDKPGAWGCMYRYRIVVGTVNANGSATGADRWTMAGSMGFKGPWDTIFREGSRYLRDGGLRVHLTIWMGDSDFRRPLLSDSDSD